MAKESYWVEVGYDEIVHQTDMAILFLIGGDEVWIPISQLKYEEVDERELTFEIPEWLALEKGLI